MNDPFLRSEAPQTLEIRDLVAHVPRDWTIEPTNKDGETTRTGLRFSVAVEDSTKMVRAQRVPRFEGAILIECEPINAPLNEMFQDRMRRFAANFSSVRVIHEGSLDFGGLEAFVREHTLLGPGGILFRQRFFAFVYNCHVYIAGMANVAGAPFEAAARAFDGLLSHFSLTPN